MARALCELHLELQNGLPCTIVVSVGKEKVCYWLSNDIVGLVGNLAV